MNMSKALYLSHWDAEAPVVVPPNVLKHLTNYHIVAIRYLYGCYIKGQEGAVLNEEDDMNFQMQISVFLDALHTFATSDLHSIIVCDKQSLHVWHYYLSKYTGDAVSLVCEKSGGADYSKIILSTVENLKLLKHTNLPFFIVTIDDLDLNLNRKLVKQLKGRFRIGLTKRNFLRCPDQKLFRNMLLWAVPGAVGKLDEFIKEEEEHLNNLRCAYSEWWFRLTWSFCDKFKRPSETEKLRIKESVESWSDDNYLTISKEENTRPKKKRKKKVQDIIIKPARTELDSSQETIVCDQEENQNDFPILKSIIDDVNPCNFGALEEPIEDNEVLSMLLHEPKMEEQESSNLSTVIIKCEDDLESRNRDVLSLLYGDRD